MNVSLLEFCLSLIRVDECFPLGVLLVQNTVIWKHFLRGVLLVHNKGRCMFPMWGFACLEYGYINIAHVGFCLSWIRVDECKFCLFRNRVDECFPCGVLFVLNTGRWMLSPLELSLSRVWLEEYFPRGVLFVQNTGRWMFPPLGSVCPEYG